MRYNKRILFIFFYFYTQLLMAQQIMDNVTAQDFSAPDALEEMVTPKQMQQIPVDHPRTHPQRKKTTTIMPSSEGIFPKTSVPAHVSPVFQGKNFMATTPYRTQELDKPWQGTIDSTSAEEIFMDAKKKKRLEQREKDLRRHKSSSSL